MTSADMTEPHGAARGRAPQAMLDASWPILPRGAVIEVDPLAEELGERFDAAGHQLYLVGGCVRDPGLAQPPTWTSAPTRRPTRPRG